MHEGCTCTCSCPNCVDHSGVWCDNLHVVPITCGVCMGIFWDPVGYVLPFDQLLILFIKIKYS